MPAYIAFYVLLPQAAGGRLYSDRMGRIAFLLLLVFSMPIGFHHLFADPQIGAGFKFLHAVFTGMVAVPTLLTIFTICASLEIAGRLRGGRGLLGWIAALPWDRPLVLASALSLRDAGPGRCGRAHQHELRDELDDPQHAMGHRPFPPDLRRRDRDHVLRDRLRAVAAPDRPAARGAEARAAAAVDLVHRHAGHHAALARGRRHGTAAAHGLLRLHRSRAGAAGDLGQPVGDRRLRARVLRAAADRRAGRVAPRAERPRFRRSRSRSRSIRRAACRPRSTASACGCCWWWR